MSFLTLVWLGSLFLAAGALAIMVVLILARLFTDRIQRRRKAQERFLIPVMLGEQDLPPDGLRSVSKPVLTGLSTQLIRLVRGGDREAFVARATQLGVPRMLARQLRSGSARTRLAAAEAIGAFNDAETLAAMRRALDDRNDDVRLAAALSLATAGDAHGAGELARKLGLGTREPSLLMLTLFARIAEARPVEIRALAESSEAHPRVRLAAIEALVRTGDFSLVPIVATLARAAPDDSEDLPRYLHALGELGHPAGSEAVLEALSRPAAAARAAAANAAGKIGLVDAAPALAALLDDAEWWVRFQAADALIALGPRGRELLREAAVSHNPRVRDAAESMLAERKVA